MVQDSSNIETKPNNDASKLSIAVIIPTLNRDWSVIGPAVKSILPQIVPDDLFIIVDQSDSPDKELLNFCKDHKEKLIYYHLDEKGLPNARNVGISKTPDSIDIILFIDDDVVAVEDFLDQHRKEYHSEEIGGVAGRVYNPGQKDYGKETGEVLTFSRLTGVIRGNANAKFRTYVDTTMGGNSSYRKSLLLEIQGFDKQLAGHSHLEESDVAMSIKKLGYKLVFQPAAELEHFHVDTGGCRVNSKEVWVYWFAHNYTLFFLRYFSFICFPIFLVSHIMKYFLWSLKALNPMLFFTGIKGIYKGWSTFSKAKRIGISEIDLKSIKTLDDVTQNQSLIEQKE